MWLEFRTGEDGKGEGVSESGADSDRISRESRNRVRAGPSLGQDQSGKWKPSPSKAQPRTESGEKLES